MKIESQYRRIRRRQEQWTWARLLPKRLYGGLDPMNYPEVREAVFSGILYPR